MCFFNFIQQDYAVWLAAYTFCKLTAFFIPYISRRRTYQTAHSKFFHVLTHIYANERILTVKHVAGKRACKLRLTYTRRPKEDECTDRLLRIFQSYPVALNSFHYF
eukprot:Mycagemm_TRINITY_DN10695_c0_g1::TRINITY_DN10695_c0_g1_i1::g.4964::m.4964 type:complete len:106 gc:universal TRINITY_DN10695_c0_g1_i1:634-317(-)